MAFEVEVRNVDGAVTALGAAGPGCRRRPAVPGQLR
jgi:hypothetical protein